MSYCVDRRQEERMGDNSFWRQIFIKLEINVINKELNSFQTKNIFIFELEQVLT